MFPVPVRWSRLDGLDDPALSTYTVCERHPALLPSVSPAWRVGCRGRLPRGIARREILEHPSGVRLRSPCSRGRHRSRTRPILSPSPRNPQCAVTISQPRQGIGGAGICNRSRRRPSVYAADIASQRWHFSTRGRACAPNTWRSRGTHQVADKVKDLRDGILQILHLGPTRRLAWFEAVFAVLQPMQADHGRQRITGNFLPVT